VFTGERLRDVGLAGFPEAIYAATANGWMESMTFVSYVKALYNFAKQNNLSFPYCCSWMATALT